MRDVFRRKLQFRCGGTGTVIATYYGEAIVHDEKISGTNIGAGHPEGVASPFISAVCGRFG
jgi:hypothetical protein